MHRENRKCKRGHSEVTNRSGAPSRAPIDHNATKEVRRSTINQMKAIKSRTM